MSEAKRFKKATKEQSRLRLGLVGPAGSGKTYTALRVAKGMGGRVAVIDSERGSASKYSDKFTFDVLELTTFAPADYVAAIHAAEAEGYDIVIIDSLSHAWMGRGGALEMVDAVSARQRAANNFTAWREVTPQHNAMVDAIIQSRCHVIGTMRAKTEYVLEENDRGKKVPKKLGMAPVQRDGLEFEFDVVGDLDEGKLLITKTRFDRYHKAVLELPGEDFGKALKAWLSDGVAPAPKPPPAAPLRALSVPNGEAAAMEVDRALAAQAAEQDGPRPPPAPAGPSAYERIAAEMQAAKDMDALRKLVMEANKAKAQGVTTKDQHEAIKALYQRVKSGMPADSGAAA